MEYLSFPGLGINNLPVNSTAFSLFGIDVQWYGVIIVIGMIGAYIVARSRARFEGITSDDMYDVLLWTIVIGVVGARLYYVAFEPDRFFVTEGSFWSNVGNSLLNIVNLRSGGLGIYGGIIFGALALLMLSKIKKIRYPVLLDVAAPAAMLGQIVGRWGNFMNIEAYGRQTVIPLRMCSESIASEMLAKGYVDGEGYAQILEGTLGVHPTFFYESMWNLAGLVLILLFYKKKKYNGQVILFYAAWYGLGRAMIEGLRTDSLMLGPVRISQLVAAICFVVCTALFFLFMKKTPKGLKLVPVTAAPAVRETDSAEDTAEDSTEDAAETDGDADSETDKT